MVDTAVALRPKLLMRALELCGGHQHIAEDLVQDVYLALVRKPPTPRTPAQLHHWLRSVLRNIDARRWRALHGEELPESFDRLMGWTG